MSGRALGSPDISHDSLASHGTRTYFLRMKTSGICSMPRKLGSACRAWRSIGRARARNLQEKAERPDEGVLLAQHVLMRVSGGHTIAAQAGSRV